MFDAIKSIKRTGRKVLNMKKLPGLGNAFLRDYFRWAKYSLTLSANNSPGKQKAVLLMNLHAVEKGLSFKNAKKDFGKGRILHLLQQTDNHLSQNGKDSLGLAALGVLHQYMQHPQISKNDSLETVFQSLIEKHRVCMQSLIGGTKLINKDAISFDLDYTRLYHFSSTRHSVRNFSDEDVTEAEILKAVRFAQTAPSVCNRQTVRVHVFSKNSFENIVKAQLGDQGWVKNANKLIIITTDLNYFGGAFERNQAFIEGGLFSMQFVMGLHAQKIASCCKMYIRSPRIDKEVYNATGISKNEVPIMLILIGHYGNETIKVPYSFRFPEQEMINFH